MSNRAVGSFNVTLEPQPLHHELPDTGLGRMTIEKRFDGDLDATSQGEMLSVRTGVQGSAGYVAVELVSGTLAGRRGTFVLQHSGTLTRGESQLSVTVVPDSATGELAGLRGAMTINIVDGAHTYTFDYSFVEAPAA